jgi:hypothetical protein
MPWNWLSCSNYNYSDQLAKASIEIAGNGSNEVE